MSIHFKTLKCYKAMDRKVKIESMAFGGYGVARLDGKVIFIPYTVTGDEVWIEIAEEKKRYSMGRLIRVVDPSPLRVVPPCPSFGSCGGCQWQHIDPCVHGEMKKTILIETLKRLGKLDQMPPVDVVPSPKPYACRVRVQLKARGKAIGYYQEKSRRIVDIDQCPIAHPLVNRIIFTLREKQDIFSNIEEIEINVSPEQGKGVLLFHPHSHAQQLEHFVRQLLQGQPILQGIAIAKQEGWALFNNPTLSFTVFFKQSDRERTLSFRISPGSFSQVNFEQNKKLIQAVLEFSGVKENEKVFDLYAGIGNFTLPLAIHAGEVLGIEENRVAVEDAKFNAERNGIRNAQFIEGKVEEVLRDRKRGKPDLMILDPPRAGCKKVVDQIAGLKPKKIIYVSCEPTTFTRDLRLFTEKRYSLEKLRLIDMFPQTYHMEVVGLLTQD